MTSIFGDVLGLTVLEAVEQTRSASVNQIALRVLEQQRDWEFGGTMQTTGPPPHRE
jgi:hypothetical protein